MKTQCELSVGEIIEDIAFGNNTKYKIIESWINVFNERIYILESVENPHIKFREREFFVLKDFRRVNEH